MQLNARLLRLGGGGGEKGMITVVSLKNMRN